MYEIFARLLNQRNLKAADVCRGTGLPSSLFSEWKRGKSTPKADKMKKIADFFEVSVDYLLNGEEGSQAKESTLTPKDERDITKDLDNIMAKLKSGESGPASYDGQELDPEAAELFRDELELALKRLKIINKEKYTNKRFKK